MAAHEVVGVEGGVEGVSEESKIFEWGFGTELGMKESVVSKILQNSYILSHTKYSLTLANTVGKLTSNFWQ